MEDEKADAIFFFLLFLGVGSGQKPEPKYLRPGTNMEVHITGIGTLKNGVDFA